MGDDAELGVKPFQSNPRFSIWQTISFLGERAVIRSFRIAGGGAVLLIALSILDHARDILGRRFADLSPLDLGNGLVSGAFGIAIVWLALYIAFGPGRSLYEEKREWHKAMELEEYCQLILGRIRENWTPPANARIPSRLILDAYQAPGGEVNKSSIGGLDHDVELKESLAAAIQQALPFPRAPYLSRSMRYIQMTFYPNGVD